MINCSGVGCLLRESCERYEEFDSGKRVMISTYCPSTGCRHYIQSQLTSVMDMRRVDKDSLKKQFENRRGYKR